MRIGKCYLIHCGDWHTFVGQCAEQLGPLTYALNFVSKVDMQNLGDRWHDLCSGNREVRAGSTYFHQPGELILPLAICAIEIPDGWLPHPDYAGLMKRKGK